MSRQSGFSLLEMLVAMTLLGLIGALAANGIRFGTQSWERAQQVSDRMLEEQALRRFLRTQIGAARPVRAADGSRSPPVVFDGGPDNLTILAPLRAALGPSGLHLIRIGAVAHADGTEGLALGWTPAEGLGGASATQPAVEPLADDPAGIALRYFGPDAEGTPVWQSAWAGRAALPALVELTLIGADGMQRAPMVIALDAAGGG